MKLSSGVSEVGKQWWQEQNDKLARCDDKLVKAKLSPAGSLQEGEWVFSLLLTQAYPWQRLSLSRESLSGVTGSLSPP